MIEFLLSLLLEVLFGIIFYWPGWLLLRLITLGRYPPKQSVPHNRYAVASFAMAVLLVAIFGFLDYVSRIRP
jgi:hypothetical protein